MQIKLVDPKSLPQFFIFLDLRPFFIWSQKRWDLCLQAISWYDRRLNRERGEKFSFDKQFIFLVVGLAFWVCWKLPYHVLAWASHETTSQHQQEMRPYPKSLLPRQRQAEIIKLTLIILSTIQEVCPTDPMLWRLCYGSYAMAAMLVWQLC